MHSLLSNGADKEAQKLLVCYERSMVFLDRIIDEKCALMHYEPSVREQTEKGMYCPTYYAFYEHKSHKSSSQIYPVFKWKLTSDDEHEALEECISRIIAQIKQHLKSSEFQPAAIDEAKELKRNYQVRLKLLGLIIQNKLALSEYYPLVKALPSGINHSTQQYRIGYVHKLHTTSAQNFPQFITTQNATGVDEAYANSANDILLQIKAFKQSG